MGLKVTDDAGNEIELPVEKVEDIQVLQERVNKIADLEKDLEEARQGQHPDWRATREIIDRLTKERDALKTPPTPPVPGAGQSNQGGVNEEKAGEIAQAKAVEAVQNATAQVIEKKRDRLIDEVSNGDANKKKVILEKFNKLTNGKKITDEDEMISLLTEANILANATQARNGGSTFDRINSGGMGHAPARTSQSVNLERGVELAKAMGYKLKTDEKKLINR